MSRNPALAKIHIAKKELALDDDTYRAMLQTIAGVTSSKELSDAGAAKVLAHLRHCGWKPKKGNRPRAGGSRQALVSKIEALLAEAHRPWSYADAMARHMFYVDKTDWLAPEQLIKLVGALTYDAKRHGRPLA
ncbi:gp16 family protein [Paludibacterium yongneupense]|uniref:gp16 family protein n=1 Tax=Paludibacterium yongneupense TaxID=400061 RepID=UPI000416BA35|nr:regulatory protein GemA [Paludibacterium yongneupense]